MLKEKARELALEKEKVEEFEFLERIERIGVEAFMEFKGSNIGKESLTRVIRGAVWAKKYIHLDLDSASTRIGMLTGLQNVRTEKI